MSNKTYSETKFAEHVYHSFHGCLVSNCNWWQIQEPIQTNGNWLARTDWIILHRLTKVDHTLTSDSGILSLRSYHWKTRFKHKIWNCTRHSTQKKLYIGSGSWVSQDLDSEFNSIHFGIEINKRLTLSFTPYQTFIFLEILFKIRNQHKIPRKKVDKKFHFLSKPTKISYIFLTFFRPKNWTYVTFRDTRDMSVWTKIPYWIFYQTLTKYIYF